MNQSKCWGEWPMIVWIINNHGEIMNFSFEKHRVKLIHKPETKEKSQSMSKQSWWVQIIKI